MDNLDNSWKLIHACRKRQTETVSQLLESGANVNGKDRHGFTPHEAVMNNYEEIMLMLLDKGADVDLMNKGAFTPLRWQA